MIRDPLDALERVILCPEFPSAHGRPGAMVARMGPEIREALSRLTSDMTARQRPPSWFSVRH